MMWLNKREAPPRVATDTVVPFHFLDGQSYIQTMVVEFAYRFDDVLDPTKLKLALERLMQIGDWRKLGGRVRRNAQGKLEYHIPAKYDESRPGFSWSCKHFDQKISDHPVVSKLPHATNKPALFDVAPKEAHDLLYGLDHPTTMEDWLYSDRPPLTINVSCFEDGAFVAFVWSHTFFDGMAKHCFLQAWIAVLNGREEDIPEYIGFDKDPMATVWTRARPEKYVLYEEMLRGWRFFLFVIGILWTTFFNSIIKPQGRAICLPAKFVQDLREKALNDISPASNSRGPEKLFLSEGDVLLAWWSKIIAPAFNFRPSRPIHLINVMTMRGMFDELPAPAAFIGNSVAGSHTFMTAQQLLDAPLGVIALQIRHDLLQQRTPEQLAAGLALYKQLGQPPAFGHWNQFMIPWSNWQRAQFHDFDFSAALPDGRKPKDAGGVKADYIHLVGHIRGFSINNGGGLIGRDAGGNWWMNMTAMPSTWKSVEKRFPQI